MEKFAWIMSPNKNWDDKKDLITTSLESGINHILAKEDEIRNIKKLANTNIISNNPEAEIYLIGINGEGDNTIPLSKNLEKSKDLQDAKEHKNLGQSVAAYIEIIDKDHEQLARKLGKTVDYLILVGKDWTVIPLENILADLQSEN